MLSLSPVIDDQVVQEQENARHRDCVNHVTRIDDAAADAFKMELNSKLLHTRGKVRSENIFQPIQHRAVAHQKEDKADRDGHDERNNLIRRQA